MNLIVKSVTALALVILTPASYALTIGDAPATDVGLFDIFVTVSAKNELPNSNPTSEENWVESILGFDVSYEKYGNNVPLSVTNEDPTAFVWELAVPESDYFLIKNAAYWALYENIDSLAYAVVDADSGFLPEKMNFGNATISHYGVVNGRTPPVCEPPDCIDKPPVDEPPTDVPAPAPVALIALALVLLRRFTTPRGV